MGYKCDAFHGEYDVDETPLISGCSWSCSSKCIDFADLKYDRPTSHYCLYFTTFRTTQKLLLLGKNCAGKYLLYVYVGKYIFIYFQNTFVEQLFSRFIKRRKKKDSCKYINYSKLI